MCRKGVCGANVKKKENKADKSLLHNLVGAPGTDVSKKNAWDNAGIRGRGGSAPKKTTIEKGDRSEKNGKTKKSK